MATLIRGCTVRQPWAHLLAEGYKDLENRDWRPLDLMTISSGGEHVGGGGWVAIHAGLAFDEDEIYDTILDLKDRGVLVPRLGDTCTLDMLRAQRGHILAVGRIAEVVEESKSPWFVGRYGWVFGPMIKLPTPVAHRGGQGLWHLEPQALAEVRAGFAAARTSGASTGGHPCP